MLKTYNPVPVKSDPSIEITLPCRILKDLTRRSLENGTNLNMEISIRLARALERDLEMIAEDNKIAFLAFQMQNSNRG